VAARPQTAAPAPKVEVKPAPAPAAKPAGVSAEGLMQALLAIVSEKTGYPVETLEPGMDMEADLGIDSIKRVEILGAMQTQFPALPKVEATELAELRTLGQIAARLSAGAPAAVVAPAAPAVAPAAPAPVAVPGISAEQVAQGAHERGQREDGLPGGDAGTRYGYGSRFGH